jgi:hypothetical protein
VKHLIFLFVIASLALASCSIDIDKERSDAYYVGAYDSCYYSYRNEGMEPGEMVTSCMAFVAFAKENNWFENGPPNIHYPGVP